MGQRADLENQVVQAIVYIQQGYSPEEAVNLAGISNENIIGALEVTEDGNIGVAEGVSFPDEVPPRQPTVTAIQEETYVSGGTSVQTTGATQVDNPKSLVLQAQADQLEKDRVALLSTKVAENKPNGLSTGAALRAASQDSEVKSLRADQKIAQSQADSAKTEVPGVTTFYNAAGDEITQEEYNTLKGVEQDLVGGADTVTDNNIIVGQNTTGVVSSDDPAVAALQDEAEFDAALEFEQAQLIEANRQAVQVEEDFKSFADSLVKASTEEADDWRVRLHLGKKANYLYKDSEQMQAGSILAPLVATDGIIFPYTPQISVQYNADYSNYDLVHSNYRGYFYKGSQVQNIILTATFTANDIPEANYLLASLHFLRSCTKMFYGQDVKRGMPPPIVFLTGLGEYQFNNHPCAITQVNYNMPNDVDYIACGQVKDAQGELVEPIAYPSVVPTSSASRLAGANLKAFASGDLTKNAGSNLNDRVDNNGPIIYEKATYVPTKIDINFTMIPIQTRHQVSKHFSLKDYAAGKLLKKGYW